MFWHLKKRIGHFLGITPSEVCPPDPEAVLETQKEIFRNQIAHYNQTLAASVAFYDVLKQQIAQLEDKERALRTALDAQAQAGNPSATGPELALRWQSHRDELANFREQLHQAEITCAEITATRDAAIQEARKKFAELKGTLSEAQIQKVLADVMGSRSSLKGGKD